VVRIHSPRPIKLRFNSPHSVALFGYRDQNVTILLTRPSHSQVQDAHIALSSQYPSCLNTSATVLKGTPACTNHAAHVCRRSCGLKSIIFARLQADLNERLTDFTRFPVVSQNTHVLSGQCCCLNLKRFNSTS
jgi:hypothetical protein